MLTPVTPLCYLTISQSENCAWADHIPCSPPSSPGFFLLLLFFFFNVSVVSNWSLQWCQPRCMTCCQHPGPRNEIGSFVETWMDLPWLLKMLCWNPLRSSGLFRAWATVSLHGPAINLSLPQTPTFWCVWPHVRWAHELALTDVHFVYSHFGHYLLR